MSYLPQHRPPLVFVSHDLEASEQRSDLLGLANRLREDGVDARLDLYEPGPAEGWAHWREHQVFGADFVIVVCSASYRRGFEAHEVLTGTRQVRWEAELLRQRIYDGPRFGSHVLPVLLPGMTVDAVPEALRGYGCYSLPADYDDLLRRITGQPEIVLPPLGTLRRDLDNVGRRPPVFEGREDDLARLGQALARSSAMGTCTVITGMGGVGKTRLALEYAHRHEHDYDVRWRVRAGDLASLQEDLVRLGSELGVVSPADPLESSARKVLTWLSTHQRWLVIFDDADGLVSLVDWLPSSCRGHVIITSRARAWRSIAEVVELGRLSPEAARAVLLRRGGRADDGSADELAVALGHLPLALVQAGAYVETTGCSFRRYREHLERDGLALMRDPKAAPDGGHETVTKTWEISLAEIRTRKPLAAELLHWLAFLDPSGVPIPLLSAHIERLPPELAQCLASPTELDDAIAVLLEFGMIERDEDILRVHRLVQAVTRERLPALERRRLAEAVVQWACTIFAYVPTEMRLCDVPAGAAEQVMALGTVDDCISVGQECLAKALSCVGDYHLVRGACGAARSAHVRALEIRTELAAAHPGWGRAQRALAASLNRLGKVELRLGNYLVAHDCFRRAFDLRNGLFAADPDSEQARRELASSLDKLGDLEIAMGELEQAHEYFRQTAKLLEELARATPTSTLAQRDLAMSLGKLGQVRAQAGYVDQALALLRRAVAIVETLVRLEPGNTGFQRDLSHLLNNLGEALAQAGHHDAAREHFRRDVAIAEALAAKDPDNMQAQRDLSLSLNRWGRAEQHAGHLVSARRLLRRGLDLRLLLARVDPHDARARHDLSLSYRKLGDLEAQDGNHDAAIEHYGHAAELLGELMRAEPSNRQARLDLAQVYVRMAGFTSSAALEGTVPNARAPGPEAEHVHGGLEPERVRHGGIPKKSAAILPARHLERGRTLRDIEATHEWLDVP